MRYNAVHKGAEREVFPLLQSNGARPGIVAFTATSWRQLIESQEDAARRTSANGHRLLPLRAFESGVDVCMTGPANAAQAGEALRAAELGPMSEEELAWMRRVGDFIHNH